PALRELHSFPTRRSSDLIKQAMEHSTMTIAWAFLIMSAATIVIAAIDVPFQLFDYKKNMRMTKQEVKDEYKDTEGKPEVKGRLRDRKSTRLNSSHVKISY